VNTDDGEFISISNIENISVNMYDYIDNNTIIGSVIDNYFYLSILKDDEYLSYEEYI